MALTRLESRVHPVCVQFLKDWECVCTLVLLAPGTVPVAIATTALHFLDDCACGGAAKSCSVFRACMAPGSMAHLQIGTNAGRGGHPGGQQRTCRSRTHQGKQDPSVQALTAVIQGSEGSTSGMKPAAASVRTRGMRRDPASQAGGYSKAPAA